MLEVRSYADLTRGRCDEALAASQLYMSEAIEKGDAQLEQQMRAISGKITDLDATSENVSRYVAMWKSRLDAIQGSGMYDAMDAIDAALQELDSFDIQAEMDKMEARLKQFAKIRMEELTQDEMRDIKGMMEQMEEWLYDADNMADECQSNTQEMNNLLDDWQSNADDIYSTLESTADDILAAFEDIYGELDSAQASAEDLISMIESAIDDIYEVAEQASDYEYLASSMADELQDLYDSIKDKVDDVRNMQDDAFQTALILLDTVGEWQLNHPWLFE